MTHAQRNAAILRAIEKYTKEKTVSKKIARDALIAEGIYKKNGKLRVEFGGSTKKPKAVA